MKNITTCRRSFISGGVLGLAAVAMPVRGAQKEKASGVIDKFTIGEPCLQAPAETTMGVSWCVSSLAKGVVEIADNAEMLNSRIVKGGGFGLVPIDASTINVRIENLKPGTKYWYRTITTPFTDYKNIYDAKLGAPIVGRIHSFTTLGANVKTHFVVINDTHAQWREIQPIVAKIKEINPGLIVWNGDATNTTQKKETAVEIFLNPPIGDRDFSADIPVCFVPGNHDFRGSWISKLDEVVMPRLPSERPSEYWELKRNFAVRMGDVALIGLDTGEDKPDGHPKWFGLANFEPYRKAQAGWLKSALEREDIKSAKYKVAFCHIPLFAEKWHPDYPHDGVKIDPKDYAYWSRECSELWGGILAEHGVKLVVCAHKHCYRHDPATEKRPWHHIVGGGSVGPKNTNPAKYQTVIEGLVQDGRLKIVIHNINTGSVQAVHLFDN